MSVVVMVMVVIMVMMRMVMVMVMVMLVLVLMLVLMLMVMLMLVLMVMVMVVLMLILMVVIMMVVVLAMGRCLQLAELLRQGVGLLHGGKQLLARELIPGRGDDGGLGIVLAQKLHGSVQLVLLDAVGAAQDDAGGGLDLVVVKLAEVLHIELDLVRVGDGGEAAELDILVHHLPGGGDHVGELAHAGGLNEDAVGMILVDQLAQSVAEIAHQGAADAAGVHFGDLDAGFAQEAAVDADLAELVFNQGQLLAGERLGDHFFDEGGFARPQEAGINVDNSQR